MDAFGGLLDLSALGIEYGTLLMFGLLFALVDVEAVNALLGAL